MSNLVIWVNKEGGLITSRSPSLHHHHPGQGQSHADAERRACDQKQHDEDQHHNCRDLCMMQRVVKNKEQQERSRDRNQTIPSLSQREISVPIIAQCADKKNRHSQQKQYRWPLGHAALVSLTHGRMLFPTPFPTLLVNAGQLFFNFLGFINGIIVTHPGNVLFGIAPVGAPGFFGFNELQAI
jgi:hypothetical protein